MAVRDNFTYQSLKNYSNFENGLDDLEVNSITVNGTFDASDAQWVYIPTDNSTIQYTNSQLSVKNGGISEQKLQINSVSSTKLQTDSVTTMKIQDEAVTDAKIDSMDASKLIGTSLPSGIVSSSLTSVGTLSVLNVSGTGTFGNLHVSNTGTFNGGLDLNNSNITNVGVLSSTNILSELIISTDLQGELTGNSSSATKLQTARTINGVSFDGTSNITIPTGSTQDLDDVLTTGNDAGGLNIENVGMVECQSALLSTPSASIYPSNSGSDFGSQCSLFASGTSNANAGIAVRALDISGDHASELHFFTKNDSGKNISGMKLQCLCEADSSGAEKYNFYIYGVNVGVPDELCFAAASGVCGSPRYFAMNNGSASTPAISNVNDTDTGMYFESSGLSLSTSGTKRMNINSSGNVQFGNTSSTGTTTPVAVNMGGTYGTNTQGTSGNLKLLVFDDTTNKYGLGASANTLEYQVPTSGNHSFYVNGTEIFRINNVGISALNMSAGTHSTDWAGPWASPISSTLHWSRQNFTVNVLLKVDVTGSSSNTSTITSSTAFPSDLRPTGTSFHYCRVVSNSTQLTGMLAIRSNGIITVYTGPTAGTFANTGQAGMYGLCFTYSLL